MYAPSFFCLETLARMPYAFFQLPTCYGLPWDDGETSPTKTQTTGMPAAQHTERVKRKERKEKDLLTVIVYFILSDRKEKDLLTVIVYFILSALWSRGVQRCRSEALA